jgi:hypothetical protein
MGNEPGKGGKRKGKKAEDQLFDAAFEMKHQAKMLDREAQKVQQNEAKEKAKAVAVSNYYPIPPFILSRRFLITNSVGIGTEKRQPRIRQGLCGERHPNPQGGLRHPALLSQAVSGRLQARECLPNTTDLYADQELRAQA